jgi:hypothetical protein
VNPFEIARALDLPTPLPADERLLWIGAPTWNGIARRVFHMRALSAYFVAVVGAHAVWVSANGAGWTEAALSAARLAPLGVIALCLFGILAWMMARTTCYAITDKRVIMRVGVALSLTMNIPFRCIASADMRLYADGTGDMPLTLSSRDKMAYLHLWPHARPWRLKEPVPMLISVPDAQGVARILGDAMRASLAAAPAQNARAESAPARQGANRQRGALVAA